MRAQKRLFAVLLPAVLLLTGCAQPSQKYASNKQEGVYFSIPNSFLKISQEELAKQESLNTATGAADRAASVLWQEAYTPNGGLKAADVLSIKTPDSPIVFVRTRALLGDEINSISYNSLRDVIVPLTSWVNGTKTAPNYDISLDEERVEKGARGIRSQYWFVSTDGKNQTINQTSLLSNDHTKIYILIVRCSTECFTKNEKELQKISDSFTVRGAK